MFAKVTLGLRTVGFFVLAVVVFSSLFGEAPLGTSEYALIAVLFGETVLLYLTRS